MNELEERYRRLFAAYPRAHRVEHEDEMVATLLDVAAPDQERPSRREAVSIVVNGLSCRASEATEWRLGLRLAAIVSLGLATTMAVSVAGVALVPPFAERPADGPGRTVFGGGLIDLPLWAPFAVWTVALVAILASTPTRWGWRRHVPVVAVAVAMFVVGSDATGTRRHHVGPFLAFVALSALGSASLRSRARVVAIGAVSGLALVWRWVATYKDTPWGWPHGQPAWAHLDRWVLTSDLFLVPKHLWFAFMVVGLLAGIARPRFAVATGLLVVPLGMLTTTHVRSGTLQDIAGIALLGMFLLFGTAAGRYQRPGPSGDPRSA